MIVRVAGIVPNSIVDGIGLRMAVFFQGCNHGCKGCHNPHTWNIEGGYLTTTTDILRDYAEDPLLDGITLTGGEPFLQSAAAAVLAAGAKRHKGNVWCYTGFLYEELIAQQDPSVQELLSLVDVLVDGPFILEKKDISLQWRGSSNQRILRLKEGAVVERVS